MSRKKGGVWNKSITQKQGQNTMQLKKLINLTDLGKSRNCLKGLNHGKKRKKQPRANVNISSAAKCRAKT